MGDYGAPQFTSGAPADYGQRAIAYIIDSLVPFAGTIVVVIASIIVGAVSDALGALVGIAGYVAVFVYYFWNTAYRQGTTGQSIGKQQQGISLVTIADGQPVGFGMAFVRYLVASALSSFTCGIYGILDLLWPLWDPNRQRLTDKMFKFTVVQSQATPLTVESLNPFARA